MPDEAANVAGMYVSLKDEYWVGTWTVPDFEHAVRLTCLMDDVISSSQSGVRETSSGLALATITREPTFRAAALGQQMSSLRY